MKIKMIETKSIKTKGNPRRSMDRDKLKALAMSIKANGILQPISVKPLDGGAFQLVFGHRRLAAARRLKLKAIPAIILGNSDQDLETFRIVENCQREDLAPLDEADAYAKLVDRFGLTTREISIRVGRYPGHVANRLSLSGASAEVRARVESGDLALAGAVLLSKLDHDSQRELIETGFNHGGVPSAAWIRRMILTQYLTALHSAPFKRGDATLVPEAGACTKCPKRTGQQAELWDGVEDRKEVCTDRACFQSKVAAAFARQVENLPKGSKVRTPADIFGRDDPHPGQGPSWSRGWIALDQPRPWFSGDPDNMTKRPSWRKVLGPKVVEALAVDVVQDGTGAPLQVVRSREVLKVAKKLKAKSFPALKKHLSGRGLKTQTDVKMEDFRADNKRHDENEARIRIDVINACSGAIDTKSIRALATVIVESSSGGTINRTAKALGIDRAELQEKIATMKPAKLFAVAFLCAADRGEKLVYVAESFDISTETPPAAPDSEAG